MLSKLCRTTLGAVAGLFGLYVVASPVQAQSPTNASFEVPAVTANTDSLRPTGATWTFSGQSGIRNNSAPNGSVGKQAAFLSAAPVGGNNNFGSVRQTITLKPGTYYVRYLAAVKTPSGRPQPLQFYVNSAAQGGVLNPRYLADTTTGGFEAGWTQPFIVTTAGSYELRFDATNATNYGTTAAPLYGVAYLDAVTVVGVPGAFANSGFEATSTWTLSSGATQVVATDAPEGSKVLSLASAATAAQTLSLPTGRYSVSLNIGKASVATGTLNVEVASNGAAAIVVATISASTAAEYRAYTTPGFALAAGTHIVTLRASGSTFSLDNIALNDAAPDAVNVGFEAPVLAAPSSATAAGTTVANPTNATWAFTGSGGLIQTNAGTSNTSAPRTVAGKQYLALSGIGAVAQSLSFAGGTYVAIGQVAQGGLNVLIDGTTVAKLSAATLDFREVMSAPFVVAAGTHSLGLSVDSTYTPATPKLDEIRLLRVDVPPVVSITAPANGALYQTGATVNITANASDPDGLGSLAISTTPNGASATQLATSTSSPLSTSWTNVSANSYTITATATDSTGATNATAINIRVNANPNVVVSLSPAGPVVTSATAVATTVTVTSATDSDGAVIKVEFLQDGAVATTCTKTIPPAVAPFTCALSLAPRATVYALAVRVTDNDGGITTTAPLSLRVNTAPVVTLTAACVAPCATPATVNLVASPTDSDGTIAKVEFYDGATLLTTKTAAPWTLSATPVATGSHSYTAKAFDNDNASTTSSAQVISVTVPSPSVALTAACTAPCNAPAAVTLTAAPANIVGTISKVEFYDGTTLLNTDTTSPYSFAGASVAAATHSYSAKVYVTGTTAAVATSSAQSVRVNALPTVTLTAACVAPCSNPATVNLAASPADSDGTITKVEFYDGASLLTTVTASPWAYSYNSATTGSHSYTAKAFDDSVASASSAAQAITVVSAPPSVALTAACTAPCNAPAAVTLTAVPANIVGMVSKVEFYDGVTLLNTDTTSPYSFAVASVAAATHSYIAKVYVTGTTPAVATSSAQAVRVNTLPTVTLTAACFAPCSNPATVNLTASPTDTDGTIAKVEFYDGATLLTTKTASPWIYSHTTAATGSHSYTAKAFDNDNASAMSITQPVTVAAGAPSISLTTTCTTPCTDPAAVTLTAVPANIPTNQLWYVQFYDGIIPLNQAYSSPYSISVSAVAGQRNYSAKAIAYGSTALATSPTKAVTVAGTASVTLAAACSPPCSAPSMVTLSIASTSVTASDLTVDFFSDDGVSGVTVLTAPYVYRIWPATSGSHQYQAYIYSPSQGGVVAISNIVTVSVAQPVTAAPNMSWTAPNDRSEVNPLGSYVLNVAASAVIGTMTSVNFYADGVPIGTAVAQNGNYVLTWQPPSGGGTLSVSGAHSTRTFYVTAVAIDSQGVTATSAPRQLSVTDYIDFVAPTMTRFAATSAASANVYVPVSFTPTAEMSMPPPYQWNGYTVIEPPWKVELLENNVVVDSYKYGYEEVPTVADASLPYEWWGCWRGGRTGCVVRYSATTFVRPGKSVGVYRYAIRVKRSEGVIWQSPDAEITVFDPAPVVTITSPVPGGSLYQGAVQVSLHVSAQSYSGVLSGKVYVDEGASRAGNCDVSATGDCTFIWTYATPGTHTITGSFDDFAGRLGSSAPLSFTVLPNANPTVEIVSPAQGVRLRSPATIKIQVRATDADGSVSKVQFFDANSQLLGVGTLNGGLYEFTLTNVLETQLNLQGARARATDNRGAGGDYADASFSVYGAPTVKVEANCSVCYADNMVLSLSSNTPSSQILQARYFRDDVAIGTITAEPFYFYDTTAPAGSHVYRVEIATALSEVAVSPSLTIELVPRLPYVVLDSPRGGATYSTVDATIPLSAIATQTVAAISKVEFFRDGGVLIGFGTIRTGRYVLDWASFSPGVHTIFARATDSYGYASDSDTVSISVSVAIIAPAAATITAPAPDSEFPAGQTVTVTAGAATSNPAITRIELWRVGTSGAGADQMLASADGASLSYALLLPTTTAYVDLYTYSFSASGGRTKSAVITVSSRADITDPRYFVWKNFSAALKAGNKVLALTYLTPTAQVNYMDVLDDAITQVSSFSASAVANSFLPVSLTDRTADYLVARVISGQRLVFGLRFVLMDDGKWKLESM